MHAAVGGYASLAVVLRCSETYLEVMGMIPRRQEYENESTYHELPIYR